MAKGALLLDDKCEQFPSSFFPSPGYRRSYDSRVLSILFSACLNPARFSFLLFGRPPYLFRSHSSPTVPLVAFKVPARVFFQLDTNPDARLFELPSSFRLFS